MILVDTSVWVNHLRSGNDALVRVLEDGGASCHPFIIGELACGHLKQRGEILRLLRTLPSVSVADHDEALAMLEIHDLAGRGLGWIDVHLLTSAVLEGMGLWTFDRALEGAARLMSVHVHPGAS